jgi:hypothetical protein
LVISERDTGFETDRKAQERETTRAGEGEPAIESPLTARADVSALHVDREVDHVPPTLDVLRRKLDAAIVAEAWDAVKAIRERIVEVERRAVIDLEAEARRRGRR